MKRTLWLALILVSGPRTEAISVAQPPSEEKTPAGETTLWPSPQWSIADPQARGLNSSQLQRAEDYALSAGGSGMIVYHGERVANWGDLKQRYDIKSATKSFGAAALGLAIADGKVTLDRPAHELHPTFGTPPESNTRSGWLEQVTLRHLATQTAGFAKRGGYEPLLFAPGTKWHYSDGGPNWLAECLTLTYQQDMNDLLFERIFRPIGISEDDLHWRKNAYRPHRIDDIPRREFGSGIQANVEALSRFGYLFLRKGNWNGEQILPADVVALLVHTDPATQALPEYDSSHGNASGHYGLLWWNNADGALPHVPRDAYWAWGLYDSLVVVIPSLDLVAVRGGDRGRNWPRDKQSPDHYAVLAPFLNPIVAALPANARRQQTQQSNVRQEDNSSTAPYPASRFITGIAWAPRDQIIRLARGSDNWPLTWADDGDLYTAYGDGWGFDPRVPHKLSLGIARIAGRPPEIAGVNIRSATGEQTGQGARGKKASGMLMVDGTLYMLVRNAQNAQLAWSRDHGQTWDWADWKFTTSFGCPTFLNFGQNDSAAVDPFVYLYSHDADSAYEPADRMVLTRVPADRLVDRTAYEFFVRTDNAGHPEWSSDISDRGAVFSHPGQCYRNGINYNAALKRYLWCQTSPLSTHPQGPRFQGGFGIYEAPHPWGPWRTVFYTSDWDVGPGETCSFPSKWMSADGKTLHLVFSGDDCFSVREAKLTLAE